MKKFLLKQIIFFTFVFSGTAFADVWTSTNTWSPEWEVHFHEWVLRSWSVDIYSRQLLPNGQKNPYYGLRADCADTVYSMRAIFSFENHLPFQIMDPTGGKKVISNSMTRFDRVADQTERFRQFLVYVWGIVSTSTLPLDTYPVAISRDTVTSGAVMVTTHVNHHSWTIQQILNIGVPHLIFNSRVHKASGLGLQERLTWPNPAWVFEGGFSAGSGAGLRYWRPVTHTVAAVWEVPGYSVEQYQIPFANWSQTVQKKLATQTEKPQATLQRLMTSVCDGLRSRISVVQEGISNLLKTNRCYDADTFDIYSTPSRDQRVFDDMMELRKAYREITLKGQLPEIQTQMAQQLNKVFPMLKGSAKDEASKMAKSPIDPLSICIVEFDKNKKIDLAEAKRRFFAGLISNNPLDGMEYRWGEKKGPSSLALSCPNFGGWSPSFGELH